MPNIVNLTLPPSITEAIDKNMCFIAIDQMCFVGDVFSLYIDHNIQYYKVIDIWSSPKDFVLKFLWRMCGSPTQEQFKNELDNEDYKNSAFLFAHMYKRIPWNEVQNMVST